MKSESQAASMAEVFAALADPTRLRLLNLIGRHEVCVCYFVEILRMGQPKISRHLAYLRRAGLVAARREGKWMHYRLVAQEDRATAQILESVLEAMSGDRQMEADRAKLERACCAKQSLVMPEGAPRPAVVQGA